jgi:hypothetical protein
LKNNKRKSIIESLVTFVLLLVLLGTVGASLYIDISAYYFSWYRDAFLICIELFLVVVCVVGFMRLLHMIKRPISVRSSGEMMRYSEEQSDEYRRQIQILCSVLETRADMVLRDSQHWQQQSNANTWNDQL